MISSSSAAITVPSVASFGEQRAIMSHRLTFIVKPLLYRKRNAALPQNNHRAFKLIGRSSVNRTFNDECLGAYLQ